jgi:hypothetical protein
VALTTAFVDISSVTSTPSTMHAAVTVLFGPCLTGGTLSSVQPTRPSVYSTSIS